MVVGDGPGSPNHGSSREGCAYTTSSISARNSQHAICEASQDRGGALIADVVKRLHDAETPAARAIIRTQLIDYYNMLVIGFAKLPPLLVAVLEHGPYGHEFVKSCSSKDNHKALKEKADQICKTSGKTKEVAISSVLKQWPTQVDAVTERYPFFDMCLAAGWFDHGFNALWNNIRSVALLGKSWDNIRGELNLLICEDHASWQRLVSDAVNSQQFRPACFVGSVIRPRHFVAIYKLYKDDKSRDSSAINRNLEEQGFEFDVFGLIDIGHEKSETMRLTLQCLETKGSLFNVLGGGGSSRHPDDRHIHDDRPDADKITASNRQQSDDDRAGSSVPSASTAGDQQNRPQSTLTATNRHQRRTNLQSHGQQAKATEPPGPKRQRPPDVRNEPALPVKRTKTAPVGASVNNKIASSDGESNENDVSESESSENESSDGNETSQSNTSESDSEGLGVDKPSNIAFMNSFMNAEQDEARRVRFLSAMSPADRETHDNRETLLRTEIGQHAASIKKVLDRTKFSTSSASDAKKTRDGCHMRDWYWQFFLTLVTKSDHGPRIAIEWEPRMSIERWLETEDALRDDGDVWVLSPDEACDLAEKEHINFVRPIVIRARPDEEERKSQRDTQNLYNRLQIVHGKYATLCVQDTDTKYGECGGSLENKHITVEEACIRFSQDLTQDFGTEYCPLNCLDISSDSDYSTAPQFLGLPRYMLAGMLTQRPKSRRGQPSIGKLHPSVPAGCFGKFEIIGTYATVSVWHADILSCTWVRCVSGEKLWPFVRIHVDDKATLRQWEEQGPEWQPPAHMVRMLHLKAGDVLYMPPGDYFFAHAPFTSSSKPCHMVGGMKLDGARVAAQLKQISTMAAHPGITNEDLPDQLLPMLDELGKYEDELKVLIGENAGTVAQAVKELREAVNNLSVGERVE